MGFKFVSSHAVFNTILLDIWVTVCFLLVILEMEASGTFQSNEQTKNKAAANDVKTTPVEHPTSGMWTISGNKSFLVIYKRWSQPS